MTLAMGLKFYASLTKVLRLKVRKFWEQILKCVEVTGEKLVGWIIIYFSGKNTLSNYCFNKTRALF